MKLVLALVLMISAQFSYAFTGEFQHSEYSDSLGSRKEAVAAVNYIFKATDLDLDFASDPVQLAKIKSGLVKLMLDDQETYEAIIETKNALPEILTIEDEIERNNQIGAVKFMILLIAASSYDP